MIGIIDSGIGGLTVARHLIKKLSRPQLVFEKNPTPLTSLIYYGDTARAPYGNKDPDTLIEYAFDSANLLIDKGCDKLIVACHTLSAIALDQLQEHLPIPVIGVIEPGIKQALEITDRISVLATEATIQSEAYQKHIPIRTIPCPEFVPMIEEGRVDPEIVRKTLAKYLWSDGEALILGCTHYPIISDLIQDCVGKGILLVDASEEVAQTFQVKGSGYCQFMVSGCQEEFTARAKQYLDLDIFDRPKQFQRA